MTEDSSNILSSSSISLDGSRGRPASPVAVPSSSAATAAPTLDEPSADTCRASSGVPVVWGVMRTSEAIEDRAVGGFTPLPTFGVVEARRLDDADTKDVIDEPDDARLCFVLFVVSGMSCGLADFDVAGDAVATAVLTATVALAPDGVPPVYGEVVGLPLPGMKRMPLLALRCGAGVLGSVVGIRLNGTAVIRPGRTRIGVGCVPLLWSLNVGERGESDRGLSDRSPERADSADFVDLTEVLRFPGADSTSGGVLGGEAGTKLVVT